MLIPQYKFWPDLEVSEPKTNASLLILSLHAVKFKAKAYMELPLDQYSEEKIDQIIKVMRTKRQPIVTYSLNGPDRFYPFVQTLFAINPELIMAFDIMAWDLWAQLYKTPFQKLISLPAKKHYEIEHFQHAANFDSTNNDYVFWEDFEVKDMENIKQAKGHVINMRKQGSKDFMKTLIDVGVKNIWVLGRSFEDEVLEKADGVVLDLLLHEGFTNLIPALMKWRKDNRKVAMLMPKGSKIGQTVYAQFAPVLNMVLFPREIYDVPATGLEVVDKEISFPQAPGFGLSFVDGFW